MRIHATPKQTITVKALVCPKCEKYLKESMQ